MIPFYNSAPSKIINPPPEIPLDVLSFLKTKQSSSNKTIAPVTYNYDSSKLSNLSNLSSELLAGIKDVAAEMESELLSSFDAGNSENASKAGNMKNEVNGGDTDDDGFLLAMIFKIVPIGINIASRGKTIVQGFKETSEGIVNLLLNLSILTATIGLDTIELGVQFGVYVFKLLLCSVTLISSFPKCFVFYFIHLLINLLLVVIVSILFMVDVFTLPKTWAGIGAVEILIILLGLIEEFDKFLYKIADFHLVHYPDSINDMCYNCSAMGDTSAFKRVAGKWVHDVFVKVPNDIGGPIGESITGIGHIFSFLDIS